MCTAPGMAPASYSSGSRTSRTAHPSAMRSAAPAVSTSVISDLAAFNRSRKLAMVKTLAAWSGIDVMLGAASDSAALSLQRLGVIVRRAPAGSCRSRRCRTASARPSISVGPPLTMTTLAPVCLARGTQ